MRYLALILLLTSAAQAETTISAVGALSNDLGYERTGYGLQLDHANRHNDWGYALQGTALRHPKIGAEGERYQAIGMGRRYLGDWFIEAGVEWGGYQSRFPDSSEWVKYGFTTGLGIGRQHNGTEWTLRYFAPDSTPNSTSVIAVSGETRLTGSWTIGATLERWNFDIGQERRSGTQAAVRLGFRF